ncbi:class I adenylate-forming enzyme family protein [Sessilibacter corallicola]|uniref:Class I adenylate-forming enzyme family protein n=1 Tax=Sessilibacter corallicola TaxID=2904075 RepID=A0ABQ0AE76_9GAMM|nr:class I adenylate-forming enzyme family protein [Sessilibacter corallicola]MCE2028329.1 acyl--CoA ligase [Sessilibacter corallicola]
MTIQAFLDAVSNVKNVVLADAKSEVTGEEFVQQVIRGSEEITNSGLKAGTSCLVRLSNNVASVVLLFSVLRAGGVVFVGNPHDPIAKTTGIIKKFGIGAFYGDKPSVLAIRANLDSDCDVAKLFGGKILGAYDDANSRPLSSQDERMNRVNIAVFSSGSTGDPKAILHNTDSIFANAKKHADEVGLKPTDVVAGFLPIYYSYGLVANLMGSLAAGAKFVFLGNSSGLSQEWAREQEISVLSLTPWFAMQLDIDVPSLRVMTFGGDAMFSHIAKELQKRFPKCELYSTYGLTEAGPRVATWRFDGKTIPDSEIVPLGKPLEGVELLLEEPQSDSHYGELLVKTDTRMLGYYYGIEAGFTMPDWPENIVRTEDLFREVGGDLFFVSRAKEMIVQNGEKIFPSSVESVLRRINGVVDANVCGVHCETRGQIAKAFIKANIEIDVTDVRRALLDKLPQSAIPSEYVFVDEIPRTATGKKSSAAVYQ